MATPTAAAGWSTRLRMAMENAVQWALMNQERFWAVIGTVAISGMVVAFMIHHQGEVREQAWNQLGSIQGQAFAGHNAEALKAMAEWEPRYSGTSAASYARFLKADLLVKTTQYTEAAALYASLAQTAKPDVLQPVALAAQVPVEELAGRIPEARAVAQAFMDRYPDHFMAGSILLTQARLADQAHDGVAAAALYDRYATLFPQSPWTEAVQKRRPAPPASGRTLP